MSKLFKNFVGIDISKTWFDAALIQSAIASKVIHQQFPQTPEGYSKMQQWLRQYDVSLNEETLFCMEYTGIYNTGLVQYLVAQQAKLWVEMPLRIKRAGGLQRGGDDKAAACKIAGYALRYHDQVKLWQPADSSIEKIKHLITQRERIINSIKHLTVPAEELKQCGCLQEAKMIEKLQQPAIKALQKTKQGIEALIAQTVKQDEQLHNKIQLIQSVNGIGNVTATALLVYTKGFTAFKNAKELACYCGVVPFNKTSGSSVKYRPSVSPYANMKLKKLLHLCAMSAIQNDKEMKQYFERKVLEGKNKMSVINAVRNKLVHRVFAVIRDGRIFEDNYVRKCA
ncbi:MAG: IS110 family transposase [Bacteroidota bacterium]|nr:IS110 family transposase [Bacteroidota bacterium]